MQPLLDLIDRYNMHMVLPKDIPTLKACATKNFTRVDNVFCLAEIAKTFISCDMFPQWRLQKTDHLPIVTIISMLEIEPERVTYIGKPNYKLMDWDKFRNSLKEKLEELGATDEINSEELFYARIAQLEGAIKSVTQKHVPLTRLSPSTLPCSGHSTRIQAKWKESRWIQADSKWNLIGMVGMVGMVGIW